MRRTLRILTIAVLASIIGIQAFAQDTALVMPVATVDSSVSSSLLSPDAPVWNNIQPRPIHLNRTPPLYTGDPLDDGYRPAATAQFVRDGDDVFMRITWGDPADNTAGSGARYPDAGEEHVYSVQTEDTSSFADALCIMVPKKRGLQTAYPSMMMGDQQAEVDLYFWRSGAGFSLLGAHGRETVERVSDGSVQGGAARQGDRWSVVIRVPDMVSRTPICFAIWDGGREQRDGLKYYSIWYEVE